MARPRVDRAERYISSISVDLFGPTTPSFRGRVRNVSSSGMLIDTPHELAVGDVLTARMPRAGEVMCTVVRIKPGVAGVRFVGSLDESYLLAQV